MLKLCFADWGHHHCGLALLIFARGDRPEPMRAALPVAAFLVPLPLAGHRALGPLMAASRAAAGLCSSAGSHGFHAGSRSEEHTSELQSRGHLVCRLLLEKKKNEINDISSILRCKFLM